MLNKDLILIHKSFSTLLGEESGQMDQYDRRQGEWITSKNSIILAKAHYINNRVVGHRHLFQNNKISDIELYDNGCCVADLIFGTANIHYISRYPSGNLNVTWMLTYDLGIYHFYIKRLSVDTLMREMFSLSIRHSKDISHTHVFNLNCCSDTDQNMCGVFDDPMNPSDSDIVQRAMMGDFFFSGTTVISDIQYFLSLAFNKETGFSPKKGLDRKTKHQYLSLEYNLIKELSKRGLI